jgi:glycosyltransferase involved in cell wall biosynthesis
MYTGGIDHRKNIERLVEAFAMLPLGLRRKHQLTIVCSVQDSERERLLDLAQSAGLAASALILTGYVPEDDLIDLYNTCSLFVFPSWHEGFGLPALEAMSCGAPAIASDRSSLPEVIGRSDALFDPYTATAIAGSIQRVLENEDVHDDLVTHARSQSAQFSWTEVGRRAVSSFERLVAHRNLSPPALAVHRPRLAFCSPLPPTQSGIADVSKEIIPHLSRYYRIDAVVHDDDLAELDAPLLRGHSERVIGHTKFLQDRTRYDRVVYNLGNSGFHLWMFDALREVSGAIILHDFFLSAAVRHKHFLQNDMNAWAQQLYADHGPTALFRYAQPGQSELVLRDYPCNVSIIEDCLGVIVHSDHAKTLARSWFDSRYVERWRRARLPRENCSKATGLSSREALGIRPDEFMVTSFGILNPFKHSDRLVRSFARSRMAGERNAKLVFVGGASPQQRAEVLELATRLGVGEKVHITGWTSAETYDHYLSAADIAVQLRTDSRGETSAAVLDSLGRGIPTIINANGAMGELPEDVAVTLADDFDDLELVTALDRLHADAALRRAIGERGRMFVQAEHSPQVVARTYFDAIEGIYTDPKRAALASVEEIGSLPCPDATRTARSIGETFEIAKGGTIYLDVSVLAMHDAQSGIQRVVRNIVAWLVKEASPDCRIEPVYYDQRRERFVRAASFSARFFNTSFDLTTDPIAVFNPGDIYVALDLAHHHAFQSRALLADEQRRGIKICFVVYDLLPVQFPEFFPDGVPDLHSRWLDVVAQADQALCISRTVADELVSELGARQRPVDRELKVSWFHLGADVDGVSYTTEGDFEVESLPAPADQQLTFLVVGTIEPRKGHEEILKAFNELWASKVDCRLIVVGGSGWKMDSFAEALRNHSEWGERLFWFEHPSDFTLNHIYSISDCLLAASFGEGFGLPIVEAKLHGKPAIARDLPVFREVADRSTLFFGGATKITLAQAISRWIDNSEAYSPDQASRVLSWRDSASQFLSALKGDRPYVSLCDGQSLGRADNVGVSTKGSAVVQR